MKNKRYSRGEELSNTLSHGAGTLLGITAGYFLLEKALANPHPYWATGCVLAYLVGMLASYISSTWYHGSRPGKRKELLRKFDHGAIYLHIAGTYTPFTLLVLRHAGGWGWGIFTFVWLSAIVGFILAFKKLKEHSNLETICFVGMGSAILVALKPLMDCLSAIGASPAFYARRFPSVLSRRKHRPYHSHLVDSLANPIRFFSPKVSRFGKLSVSGRKKSSPKILVKTRTTYCFNCYLCSRFQY